MRKILFFNKEPYMTFLYIAATFIISFIVILLLFLLIGCLVWSVCRIVNLVLIIAYLAILVVGYLGGIAGVIISIFWPRRLGWFGHVEEWLEKVLLGGGGVILILIGYVFLNISEGLDRISEAIISWGNHVFEIFNVFNTDIGTDDIIT